MGSCLEHEAAKLTEDVKREAREGHRSKPQGHGSGKAHRPGPYLRS